MHRLSPELNTMLSFHKKLQETQRIYFQDIKYCFLFDKQIKRLTNLMKSLK